MLKNEILVTPKNNHTFGESDKDRYIQTLSFYEPEANQQKCTRHRY
jgi:hypothetical protein